MATRKKNNKIPTIDYNGEKYKLVLNFNVMEKLQKKYETYDKWLNLISNEESLDITAVIYGFKQILNEGIRIDNKQLMKKYNNGELSEKPQLREKLSKADVGEMLTEIGLNQAAEKMAETLKDSAGENNSKNE